MSLHLMTLFTAHPAKLINLLALLLAFPAVGYCTPPVAVNNARWPACMHSASRPSEPTLDWATLRMNRFFYAFGFACMGLALLVSWISTQL
jgi:hypothetical protein